VGSKPFGCIQFTLQRGMPRSTYDVRQAKVDLVSNIGAVVRAAAVRQFVVRHDNVAAPGVHLVRIAKGALIAVHDSRRRQASPDNIAHVADHGVVRPCVRSEVARVVCHAVGQGHTKEEGERRVLFLLQPILFKGV